MNNISMKLNVDNLLLQALKEDITSEDISTNAVMPTKKQGQVELICKQDGIIAGLEVFQRVFELLDETTQVKFYVKDGEEVKKGQLMAILTGDIRVLLSGERTALNYLQRMSGIATYTNSVAKLLKGAKTQLLDTRKTTPNMRIFEKYAVRVGGGHNHRYNLSDGILLKDNHIGAAGGIKEAISMAKDYASFVRKIEIEVENLDMVKEAVEAGADIIMLDNMTLEQMREAICLIDGRAEIEVSGNVTKEKIAVKIVFLAYFDLLWPPKKEVLHNPDRFVFMFAPITRSYRKALMVSGEDKDLHYERNKNQFPASAQENMQYAQAWKEYFKKDSFIYDYHYMWNHFQDWGDYYSAKVLYEDIAVLKKNGFDGYVSCQQTRVFAPSGFGMYVMGRCLWGCDKTFEELWDEYFTALYGDRSGQIKEYTKLLSEYSYWKQPEDDHMVQDARAAADLEKALNILEKYIPVFEEYEKASDSMDQTRWKYLLYSSKAAWHYCIMLKYKREGKDKKAVEAYRIMKEFLREKESKWQEGMDLYWFIKKYDSLLL